MALSGLCFRVDIHRLDGWFPTWEWDFCYPFPAHPQIPRNSYVLSCSKIILKCTKQEQNYYDITFDGFWISLPSIHVLNIHTIPVQLCTKRSQNTAVYKRKCNSVALLYKTQMCIRTRTGVQKARVILCLFKFAWKYFAAINLLVLPRSVAFLPGETLSGRAEADGK